MTRDISSYRTDLDAVATYILLATHLICLCARCKSINTIPITHAIYNLVGETQYKSEDSTMYNRYNQGAALRGKPQQDSGGQKHKENNCI